MSEVIEVESSTSTNSDLAARAAELAPFDAIVTLDQTAGRGRAGREWIAPAGTAAAISVLVPVGDIPPQFLGWIPLAAGLAMAETVSELVPGRPVSLKWPNDVLIDGLKVSGVLAELQSSAAIVGAGLNLTMTPDQLPVATATSLVIEGADPDDLFRRALAVYLPRLRELSESLAAAHGDAEVSGLADGVRARCSTLGTAVRVELPGGDRLIGTATAIDDQGRIVVDGRAVSAGDVIHLRTGLPESGAE